MLRRRNSRSRWRRAFAPALGCLGLLALALGAPSTSAADDAAWLFDPGAVVEINLGGLSEAEIDALEAEPDEYQPGTFELKVGGVAQGPPLGEVGVRLKGGFGSFRPLAEKAAFKVKFDDVVDNQTFFGLEKLTLNNMVQDPSMTHEALAYELFRALGVPASRTGYAFVRVNGESFGVHLNVETLDSVSLPRWFASTLHLYEGAAGIDVEPGGENGFEVDEGKNKNREDMKALIAATNDNAGDWSDGVAGLADLEEMTRMWAVERYVGHWDGYAGSAGDFLPNNYYLHSDEAGLFRMLPWGTDQTWDHHLEFDEESGSLLFNRCLADASCAALYVDALRALQATVAATDLDSRAADIAALLEPWQDLEAEPRREYSAEEIEEGVEETRDFIASRPGELAEWLPALPDPPLPDPRAPIELGPPAPQATPSLHIGASRLRGVFVATRFGVPSAGRAIQRVAARLDGRLRRVCEAQGSSSGEGSLTVRCRLSEQAWQRLQSGPLRLKVRVGFVPSQGKPGFDTRYLTASRRP